MFKAYLAARYSRRDEMCEYAVELAEEFGVRVTSRWLAEQEPLNSQMGQHSEEFYIKTAYVDILDIEMADVLIFFAEDPLIGVPRGGRHVEFGYALATGKKIFVVGPKENVFHYLGKADKRFNITHFETFEHLKHHIAERIMLETML